MSVTNSRSRDEFVVKSASAKTCKRTNRGRNAVKMIGHLGRGFPTLIGHSGRTVRSKSAIFSFYRPMADGRRQSETLPIDTPGSRSKVKFIQIMLGKGSIY